MIMSSMPAYSTDQPRAEWVHSWDFDAISKPVTAPAPHRAAPAVASRPLTGVRALLPRLAGNSTISSLHVPNFPGKQGIDPFVGLFGGGLFAMPLQAQDSALQVAVGFADNSSASASFPVPWNEPNPLINFVGGGTTFHQNMRVGRLVMVQGSSAFGKDLPPFTLAAERNLVFGLNIIGLRRAKFSAAQRDEIKRAFKLLYLSGLNTQQALEKSRETEWTEVGREFFDFVATAITKRGVSPLKRGAELETQT
jgi:hypothetical protein